MFVVFDTRKAEGWYATATSRRHARRLARRIGQYADYLPVAEFYEQTPSCRPPTTNLASLLTEAGITY